MKKCLLFAGQSVQREGMCLDLWTVPPAQAILRQLKPLLGLDLEQITTRMPDEELHKTFNAQRAIHAHHLGNWFAYKFLKPHETVDAVIGNSMGILAALVVAEAISIEDSGKLIAARAHWFQSVCRELNDEYTLVAVQTDDLQDLIDELPNFPGVELALHNTKSKGTLGGSFVALNAMVEHARREDWPVTFRFLKVEGPFHTQAFNRNLEHWQSALESISIQAPKIAVFMGTSGKMETEPERIRHLLLEQPFRCEKHFDAVRECMNWGARSFLEIGYMPLPIHWISEIAESSFIADVEMSPWTTADLLAAFPKKKSA